jgi:MFS family permease
MSWVSPLTSSAMGKAEMAPRLPLLFLNIAHFCTHYFLLVFPTAVLAIHRDWGMPYGEALAFGTAAFAAVALGTLPAGWLGDRWPRSRLIVIFFIGLGLSSILAGLSHGPVLLTAGLALIGLFAAIYHPVAIAAVVQLAEGRGWELAVNGVWGNLGFAGAAVLTGLLAEAFGWRAAFILPGLVAILLGLAALLWMGRAVDAVRPASVARVDARKRPGLYLRIAVFIGIAAVFGGLIFNGVTVALPKLFEDGLGSWSGDIAHVGLLLAVAFAIAAFAQLPTGHLLDRFGARPVAIAILALQVPLLALAGQVSGPGLMAVAIGMLLLVFGEIPIADWLVGRYVAGRWQSRILAVSYLGSLGVSALAVPGVSLLYERTGGFAVTFLLLALCAATVLVTAFWLPGRAAASAIEAHALE